MSKSDEIRLAVQRLVAEANDHLPERILDPLPPDDALGGEPGWRDFEWRVWKIGEEIRQLLLKAPRLRADPCIQETLLGVAIDRRAQRGRQSFVMLLGYRSCVRHAVRLSEHLDDPAVDGHVISTLYKMRAPGHSAAVRPHLEDRHAWVRNEAKRYLAWDATASQPT